MQELIDYPCNTPGGDIFDWFSKNRGGIGKEEIKKALPTIEPEYPKNRVD
ncbi:MAG: hypothetical protein FWF71_00380 [Actinomycetia bacterium]|nr:hypothetical protein [Actinomycetes bacterium]